MTISFTVYGRPQGKGRPRFNTRTGTAYTPKETKEYERHIRLQYLQRYSSIAFPVGAVELKILAYYPIPKSDSKAVRQAKAANRIRPTVKPDADNIIKAVADALNGIAYKDDSQIVSVLCGKLYGENPRIEVEVTNSGV